MTTFWSSWIIVITLLTLAGSLWLLFANRKTTVSGDHSSDGEAPTTGHSYDGIEEYDNPLPAWWFWKFVGTVVFALIYLALYPGLGSYQGLLGWTQESQWQQSVDAAEEKMESQYASYASRSIDDLASDPKAQRMGRRLYNNNCSVCHGVGGSGANGFPNLADNDWLYGGHPEAILATLNGGRIGVMPAWGAALGNEGVINVTEYVLSLSDEPHNAAQAAAGSEQFAMFCSSCHMPDGSGMQALGAPNLTDNIWLYRQADLTLAENIRATLRQGRNGVMPSQSDKLRPEKIHLIAAYVYGLSQTASQ